MAEHSDTPDWFGAASDLVEAFVQFPQLEDRLRVLEKLCQSMDDQLYPAILQILLMVERHGDSKAKTLLAETLAYAVSIERLPEGRMQPWGSSSTVGSSFASYRNLGPLEYLCSWYAQPNALQPLSTVAFRTAMSGLLSLLNNFADGPALYQQKLLADADTPLTGALTSQTRDGLRELATQWQQGQSPDHCALAFLDCIENQQSLQNLGRNPFA